MAPSLGAWRRVCPQPPQSKQPPGTAPGRCLGPVPHRPQPLRALRPQSVPTCGGAERDRPAGGVTISIAGDNQPGQGEQALNREESPRDRPLKPGDVGHGAGKCHGGALRGYFEVRRQSPLGEGRGQCRDSARWSPPRRSRRHPEGGFSGRALPGRAGLAAPRSASLTAAPPARGSHRDATAEAMGTGTGLGSGTGLPRVAAAV